ncbi:MAG: prepilin-type N-terminal cleavage/methylation domain-containing protein [Synergistaceae bacterium]|nr:prepilin-type N-terminal cleavage/methylation domain-containing protein [Synergistaceae bacterium]
MTLRRRHKAGFTLVEVMIVIFALGVLSAMIMISSSEAVATAKATKILNDMTQIKLAVIQWYRENPYKVGTDGKVGTQTLGDYFKTDKGKAELMKHIDSTSISLNDDAVGSYTVNTSNNGKTIYWYVAYKVHDGSNKDESLMNKLEAKAATADLRRTSNFKNTNEKYHAGNETNKNIYMLIMTFNY